MGAGGGPPGSSHLTIGCFPGADGVLVMGIGCVGLGITGAVTGMFGLGSRYKGVFLYFANSGTMPINTP